MDVICKYNKFGHCRYGQFCDFYHENQVCDKTCGDVKNCKLRHPKRCNYILRGKTCKFDGFCDFDHNFGINHSIEVAEHKLEDRIDVLEEMVRAKDIEIEKLRKIIIESNISQTDGGDLDVASSENDEEGSTDEDEDGTENEEIFEETFKCETCDYQTKSRNGLKIHIGKSHKHPCDQCGIGLRNKYSLQRHKRAKEILKNVDPLESPDKTKEIGLEENDETCLVVHEKTTRKILALLHSQEC